ncbi:MAG: valine--tRNA ligase [Methanosarcinales archaeon]
MDIPKRYDAKEAERRWQIFWETEGIYKFNPADTSPIYSLDTPPPTVSGEMHIGHAMAYIQADTIMRFQRMLGKSIFYPFGFDDNGLATELYVEKKTGRLAEEMSRHEFVELCLKESELAEKRLLEDWKSLGISPDWDMSYRTTNEWCRKTSQRSFIQLYNKGRAYRKYEPTVWCPKCGTAIAQVETEDKLLPSTLYDITFNVEGEDLFIATSRPELLPACVSVFYHPTDERYKRYAGKNAKVPLFGHEVPIMADEKADPESGTGIVMCCTAGDSTDVEWWKTHNLPWISVIDERGKMKAEAGKYAGLRIKNARKAIVEDLAEQGLLKDKADISHTVNVHERCGTAVEYIMTKQWFIKYLDLKDLFLEAGAKLNWYPPYMQSRYDNWVKGLKWDWCISRQRYYGISFPVWYCEDCEFEVIAGEKDLPVVPSEDAPPIDKCPKCGCDRFKPELDVLDTWATSSLTPQIAAKWQEDDSLFNRIYPMSLRSNGHDIITFWLFNTVVKGLLHENEIPWKDVIINGFVLDPKREKMSKSKGNIIKPQVSIERYSGDALRFWACSAKLGEDLPYEDKELRRGVKMINKLWNASKFTLLHLDGYDLKLDELEVTDRWLLSKLNRLIGVCTDSFNDYEFSNVKKTLENFFWHTFCDVYLEIVKDRLYTPERGEEAKRSAQYTLYVALLAMLKMMAPIMPHITEEIYHVYFAEKENCKSIHISKWPELVGSMIDETVEETGDKAEDVISAVRKYKTLNKKALNAQISRVLINCDKETEVQLESTCADLKATLHADVIEFGDAEDNIITEKYEFKLRVDW